MKIDIPDISRWINVERVIYSIATEFIFILYFSKYKTHLLDFIFNIEYLKPLSPVIQLLFIFCLCYTIITVMYLIIYEPVQSFYYHIKYSGRRKNTKTSWKSM